MLRLEISRTKVRGPVRKNSVQNRIPISFHSRSCLFRLGFIFGLDEMGKCWVCFYLVRKKMHHRPLFILLFPHFPRQVIFPVLYHLIHDEPLALELFLQSRGLDRVAQCAKQCFLIVRNSIDVCCGSEFLPMHQRAVTTDPGVQLKTDQQVLARSNVLLWWYFRILM